MQKIQRISSNWTLTLKVFIPTFWFVFYGAIVLTFFVAPANQLQIFADESIKLAVLIFYISGSVVIYFTLIPLKRVEFDEKFLYVSNYFTTLRIPWHNVKLLREKKFLFVHTGTITFKKPVQFGKSIIFIPSRSLMAEFHLRSESLLHPPSE